MWRSFDIFSHILNHIVSGGCDGIIQVWDAHSVDVPTTCLDAVKATMASLEFSPDGTRVVSGFFDGTISVWDIVSGSLLYPSLLEG